MDLSKELVGMLSADRLNDPEDWKQPEDKTAGFKQSDWNRKLNVLRDGGTMNMYGAPRWLRENYGMSREAADQIFLDWTKTFEP